VLAEPIEGYYPGTGGRPHPGPSSIALPAELRAAIVDHLRAALPNEGCGLVVGDRPAAEGGLARRWIPLENVLASPFRYEIDPRDLLRVSIETERADEALWAIVHSHVASPGRPSPTDVRQSFYPEALYLVVSFDPREADPAAGEPSLRAWRIVDGGVHEIEVRADPDR